MFTSDPPLTWGFLFWVILSFYWTVFLFFSLPIITPYAQWIKHVALVCCLRGDMQWNQRGSNFFWRVLKQSLVSGFKRLFMQESPSVSVSVILNPMPTQSRPLTGFSSVICANVSWQLAQHGAALTGPLFGPAGRRGPSLEEGATTCYMAITLTRGRGSVLPYKDLGIRPRLPWRLRLVSTRAGGSALPHPWVSGMTGGEGLEGKLGGLVEERSSDQTPGFHFRRGTGKIPCFLLL